MQSEATTLEEKAEALGSIYREFYFDILRYINSIVCNEEAAEDITQQTFVKLMGKIKRYSPEEGTPFKGWLVRVARNTALDYLRKERKSMPVVPFDSTTPIPEAASTSSFADPLDRLILLEAIASFKDLVAEGQYRALMLGAFGYSAEEIADIEGTTKPGVHARTHIGRKTARMVLPKPPALGRASHKG